VNECVKCLEQALVNDSTLRGNTQAPNGMEFRLLTSHKNVNLSVLEAVLGSSFTTPTYAKPRTQERRAREKAEDEVNIEAVVTSTMAMVSS
jgi:hypothetical protein